ncbi:hypothetical protein BD413DRAFT_538946, partial [Trametes elegans]
MTLVPPPNLPADAMLEVFVYPENQDSALDPANPYSGSRRLEFLGRMLIRPAYLSAVWKRSPRIGADELEVCVPCDRFMEKNATAYQWHKRVRGYPDGVDPDSPDV